VISYPFLCSQRRSDRTTLMPEPFDHCMFVYGGSVDGIGGAMNISMKVKWGAWLMICAMVLPAIAETPPCAGITDARAMTVCQYQARQSHGARLERVLIEKGSRASVFVEEVGEPGTGAYPRLIILA